MFGKEIVFLENHVMCIQYKTIGDEGITVDFSIIKVYTYN